MLKLINFDPDRVFAALYEAAKGEEGHTYYAFISKGDESDEENTDSGHPVVGKQTTRTTS
jgi:hypothetical protein